MSALFTAASSQYLLSTNGGYPTTIETGSDEYLSVCLWVKPTRLGVLERFWFVGADASPHSLFIGKTAANLYNIGFVDSGGTLQGSVTGGTPVVGVWTFILGRFLINSGVMGFGGINTFDATSNGLTITNGAGALGGFAAPAFQRTSIGARGFTVPSNFFDGNVAEVSVFSGDVSGRALQNNTSPAVVRQLAYGGPCSMIQSKAKLIEYRSLRNNLACADPDDYVDSLMARNDAASPDWTNQGGAVLSGDNPPIWTNYQRPQEFRRIGLV